MEFKNRQAQNKNQVVITTENGDSFSATITRDDNPVAGGEGTPIAAEIFNNLKETADQSKQDSTKALLEVDKINIELDKAIKKSTKAEEDSFSAKTLASAANQMSSDAQKLAREALEYTFEQGSKVYENEEYLPYFRAETKLNSAQGQDNANKVMTTDKDGNIVPSSLIKIGGFKLFSKVNPITGQNSLVIEFPKEDSADE